LRGPCVAITVTLRLPALLLPSPHRVPGRGFRTCRGTLRTAPKGQVRRSGRGCGWGGRERQGGRAAVDLRCREDCGEMSAALGRPGIGAFLNRLCGCAATSQVNRHDTPSRYHGWTGRHVPVDLSALSFSFSVKMGTWPDGRPRYTSTRSC
jgi:hypothetical protein